MARNRATNDIIWIVGCVGIMLVLLGLALVLS